MKKMKRWYFTPCRLVDDPWLYRLASVAAVWAGVPPRRSGERLQQDGKGRLPHEAPARQGEAHSAHIGGKAHSRFIHPSIYPSLYPSRCPWCMRIYTYLRFVVVVTKSVAWPHPNRVVGRCEYFARIMGYYCRCFCFFESSLVLSTYFSIFFFPFQYIFSSLRMPLLPWPSSKAPPYY